MICNKPIARIQIEKVKIIIYLYKENLRKIQIL